MKKKLNIKHIALFVGFLILLNFLHPPLFSIKTVLKPGDIAPRDIIAPHTFYIEKSKKKLQEERIKARESVPYVLNKDYKVAQSVETNVNNFFNQVDNMRREKNEFSKKRAALVSIIPSLSKEDISFLLLWDYKPVKDGLIETLHEVFDRGVILSKDSIGSPFVVILGEERPSSVSELLDLNELPMFLKETATQLFSNNRRMVNTFVTLANFFATPNLTIDLAETLHRKEQAAARVETTKGIVLKGEIIIRAHDVVTQDVVDKLSALSHDTIVPMYRTVLGRNIIYLITILIFFLCIYFLSHPLLNDFRKLFLLVFLICFTIGIAYLVISRELSWYFIPIASFGILVSLLLDVRAGLSGIITLTILIAVYSSGSIDLVSLFLLPGIISIFAAVGVKRVSDFYKPTLYVFVAYICTALGVELIKLSPFTLLLKSLGNAVIGGVGAAFLAFGLLPLLERAFRITTPITLLEYADLDRPLLRELSIYAPGTYHHSITVGNLAEAAARAVGANPLLARVGAYYHDIGKLKKPSYFIENQTGINPHSKLSPELNALVVISHVKEGIELANKENLPNEIVDIIQEHQGTTLVEPFYAKAKERGGDVNELDFRYPGPLPRTKESAIVMLADAIEATARSLPDPTPSKLKGIIEDTVERRIDDGQLSKVNLSFEELKKIETSFLPILVGIFHPRIEYAKSTRKESKKESENKQERA
ncbi:MAG: HDIG domain-containing protein [bacterium]|nr:HDIG domain-containing protein [bacterium]